MTTYAVIDRSGNIINVVEYDGTSAWTPPNGCVTIEGNYAIGGTLIGGVYTPPMPDHSAPLPPPEISRRQFYQQLALQSVISNAEAMAAVANGTLPTALQTLVNALPTDQQFAASMLLVGASTFQRTHPLTLALGTAYGWTPLQIDELFAAALTL